MAALPSDLAIGASFLRRLPRFLHGGIDRPRAEAVLRERYRRRESGFLALARRGIYADPSNPFRRLLARAGCEYGDLEALVRSDGLERTLTRLLESGVYLTVAEFKGREPVRRSGLTLEAGPESVRNPDAEFHIPARSGGSRSGGTPVLIDLAFAADCAVNCSMMLSALGGDDWVKADWEVPGGGALFRLLKFSRFGRRPERWFSQLDSAAPGLHARYRWSARALRLGSLAAAAPLPRLEHVPLDDPTPIVRWMASRLEQGRTPLLFTFPSSAVRVARAARASGTSLEGARFLVSGEPITDARVRSIRGSGALVLPRYGTIECGPIGYGCASPRVPDELHLQSDLHAVIQAGRWGAAAGFPPTALFLTSLSPWAPFIFLNVSMGDMAEMDRRSCGCPLEALGWRTHISNVRSYEKLTGSGMTFLDTDVVRVLEEVLPSAFGGAPTDYQLLEEEGPEGDPVLRLLAHPGLGPLDEGRMREVFFSNIGRGAGAEKVMELLWKTAGLFRIERRMPLTTASGKVLHLHLARGGSPSVAGRRRPGRD